MAIWLLVVELTDFKTAFSHQDATGHLFLGLTGSERLEKVLLFFSQSIVPCESFQLGLYGENRSSQVRVTAARLQVVSAIWYPSVPVLDAVITTR